MRIIPFILISFFLFSCDDRSPIDPESMIQAALLKKQNAYKKKALEDCDVNAILMAEIDVDSLVLQIKRFSVLDSIEMISKPNRPNRPKYLEITDPGPIEPYETNKGR